METKELSIEEKIKEVRRYANLLLECARIDERYYQIGDSLRAILDKVDVCEDLEEAKALEKEFKTLSKEAEGLIQKGEEVELRLEELAARNSATFVKEI